MNTSVLTQEPVLLEDFYVTVRIAVVPELIRPASSNAPARKDPLWATLCALSGGLAMVASGLSLIALGVLTWS